MTKNELWPLPHTVETTSSSFDTRWGGRGRKFKSCHSDQMGNFLVAHFSLYNEVSAVLVLFKNAQIGGLLRRVFKGVTQFATQIV